jgi:cytochrome oxidase Cu insertion factor (SCO1/SenC/PrrC family)
VLAILAVYAMMEVQTTRARNRSNNTRTPVVYHHGKAQIGGDWELFSTKGIPFGSRDLKGSYYLIYFGFTNCPDICPNSLMKLTKAVKIIEKMPKYENLKLKIIFVSVDPDRDTLPKI